MHKHMEMLESSATRLHTATRKEPLIKRVWYGAAKFAESQSPEAWGKRITGVVDTKIIPKLSAEQQIWAREHRETIESAADAVGAGITTAEIVAAVALGVKIIDSTKHRLAIARSRRNTQWVRPDYDLPRMPVTEAQPGTYALSPDTRARIEAMYVEDGLQTTKMLKSVRKKWKEINPTIGSHKWLSEQLNGTLASLFDMTEEPEMKLLVRGMLPTDDTAPLSEHFEHLFAAAHRAAAERFHWPNVMPHDARAVYSFWQKRFDRLGLPELRERVGRIQRAVSWMPDSLMGEMAKHISVEPLPYLFYMNDDKFFMDALKSRAYVKDPSAIWFKVRVLANRIRELRGPILSHHLESLEQFERNILSDNERRTRMLKDAIAFIPEATWKRPAIAAKLEYALRVRHIPKTQDVETIGLLLDKAWELRRDPEMQVIVRTLDAARNAGDGVEFRRYARMLLERAFQAKPQFWEFMHMGNGYYEQHDRLRELARLWHDDLRGVGLENLYDIPRKIPGLIERFRIAILKR